MLVLGITKTQEHEGIDRANTLLPGLQEPFAQQVLALGKPTVLVLCSGGILSIDSLVTGASAIVEAYNPAVMGPRALAALLFGDENRWGKLVNTVYPANYSAQLKIQDMSFPAEVNGIGRGYRYFKGEPLFAFGHGLSYTDFSISQCRAASVKTFNCTIANIGPREGDEVVQARLHPVCHVRAKKSDDSGFP